MSNFKQYRNLAPTAPLSKGRYKFIKSITVNAFSDESAKVLGSQSVYNFKVGDVVSVRENNQENALSLTLEDKQGVLTTLNPHTKIPMSFLSKERENTPLSKIDVQNVPIQNVSVNDDKFVKELEKNVQDGIVNPITRTLKTTSLAFLGIGWLVNGVIAYKFWNKSKGWKIGIVAITGLNIYNTYNYLTKKSPSVKIEPSVTPPTSNEREELLNKISQFIDNKDAVAIEKFKKLSTQELNAALFFVKESKNRIKQTDNIETVFKKMSEIQNDMIKIYGEEFTKNLLNKLNN